MSRKARQKVEVFQFINIVVGADNRPDFTKCWLWKEDAPLSGRDSRPTFTFNNRRMLAYRVTYELMTGVDLSSDVILRHKCDNKMCCNPRHLEEGTHQQNMDDMKDRERHGLPHNTVRAIKKLLLSGELHSEIATKFGVSRQTITAINNEKVYQHVKIKNPE